MTVGVGVLNQGHRSLYERELLFLHDLLHKDAGVHDGLQLLDGADDSRHIESPAPGADETTTVPSAGAAGSSPAVAGSVLVAAAAAPPPAAAVAGSVPVAAAAAPPPAAAVGTVSDFTVGAVLPTPPHAMRLAPLPACMPVLPGSQAAREAGRQGDADWDEEEDDEIRPVADEFASQWAAYRAARR